jgi:hypothetical protein
MVRGARCVRIGVARPTGSGTVPRATEVRSPAGLTRESVGFITLDASYATVTNMRAWPSRASTPIATLRPLLQGASESISANAFAKVLVAWPSSGHRKTGVAMKRVWLQATFQKPA